MIEPIVIKVVDKVPIVVSGPQYVVCDNSDYTVVWQLDEEWAQFESRTMQVNYKDGTYERVLFTGNSCALPAIPVPGPVHVGLFAGNIHTTRPARLLAVRSATTDSGEERDSMPNGYAQAIKALDGKLDKNQGAENAGKALVVGDDGNVVPGEAQGGGSLPAMSSDTAGKMLTNDGENAEWGDAVRYDVAQNMNINEQLQARKNIDAFPGKTLQYFYDTTAGSKHDNDIVAADVYDVIRPGNTYSDGLHSNAGMEFPAYVMSSRNLALDYYEMRLLDNNGVMWNVVINKSTKALHDCSKIVATQVMCVNFTQDNGNWSADKNWDDAAALIEAGGYVYAMADGRVIPLVDYHAERPIVFHIALHDTSAVGFKVVVWFPDGTITVSGGLLPVVMYGEQELTADQQAQARKNIGAEASGTAAGAVTTHNAAKDAHSDIRLLVEGVTTRLNALANSDDTTLDQMAEVVAYIKANRELIESVTTAKVNVTDIIDNLTTNASNKPLSAAQGVALKALIDAIDIPDVYTLPVASPTQLGGVKPVAKTDAMIRGVGVDSNGGLYTEPDSVYYIDLEGTFPNFTTSKTDDEIYSAYQSGKTLFCRFFLKGGSTIILPLLFPGEALNVFASVMSTGDPIDADSAQAYAVVVGSGNALATEIDLAVKSDIPIIPTALPNPKALTIKVGDTTTTYDGSAAVTIDIPNGNEVAYG